MRHIRFFFLLLPVLAVALVAAGCGGGGGGSVGGDTIAKVGDDSITKAEFDTLIARARQGYQANHQPFPKPGTPDYKHVQDQAVQFLVQRDEFAQEAKDMGITISDSDVQNRLQQIKKQYFHGDQKAYEAQVKKQHLTQDEIESDLRNQLISQKLYDKVTADVTVTPDQVTAYYNAHKAQYHQPESRTVRHILICIPGPNAPGGVKCRPKAKAKAFADQLYQQLKGGANFATLAKKYSQDQGSATQGGKLTITKGQTVPPFDKTAFSLKTGQLAPPVATIYGYHIIQALEATKPATTTPLGQVREAIKQQLLQQKKQEKMASWVKGLDKKFHVKYAAGYEPTSTSTSATVTTGSASTVATTSAATTTG